MSVPNRRRVFRGATRWPGASVLAAGAVAVGALLTTGAEARSQALPANVSPPTISGTAVAGEELTASVGSWTGTPPITFTFAWLRCDAGGASCAPIAGATAQTYVLGAGDIGSTVRVEVTGTNAEGFASAQSAPTALVTAQTAPVNTAEPVISGSPVEGSTLNATTGTWTGTSITFAYQWVRCGPDGGLSDGSNCPSIPGATSESYTLDAADIGQRLRVQVTASNATGATAAASNATDVITQSTTTGPPRNTVEPSISGVLAVGRVLFASVGTWSGETPITFTYQWVRCGDDGGLPDGSNCTFIEGATTSSYIPATDDVGHPLRIRITATNSLGTDTVASNATAAIQSSSTTVGPSAPRNTFLPTIFGSPAVGTTLTATNGVWTGTAPLLYSYQWRRCDAGGGSSTGLDCPEITGATGTQYVPTTADLGRRLRVQVTARNTLGTTVATSNATALVQAAGSGTTPPPPPTTTPPPPANLPPGAVRLPAGMYSVPVTSVSPPQRLVAGAVDFVPDTVRSRARPFVLRVRVLDTRGYAVRDALVFVRSTPLVTSSTGEVRTGRDGWARVRVTPQADFPLNRKSVQFFVRVRKQSDELLEGVSNRRLVQVATARG
jgi:hypothetical protein